MATFLEQTGEEVKGILDRSAINVLDFDTLQDGYYNRADYPFNLIANFNEELTANNYTWAIRKDGILHSAIVIPELDNSYVNIIFATRNQFDNTTGPLGNALLKYSGFRITTFIAKTYDTIEYLQLYKLSNAASIEVREFVFGENANRNAYLLAAAQMSGIGTIDCKWIYTNASGKITNVDAIFTLSSKSLTYVEGNYTRIVVFNSNGSYVINSRSDIYTKYIDNPFMISEGKYLPNDLGALLTSEGNGFSPDVFSMCCRAVIYREEYNEIGDYTQGVEYTSIPNIVRREYDGISVEAIFFYEGSYHVYVLDVDHESDYYVYGWVEKKLQ